MAASTTSASAALVHFVCNSKIINAPQREPMPKFRARCDNPKTDFESASLHTAKAAAKDVSLRAHEPVRVIEVAEDGAEKVVHEDPPRHPDLHR